jgi:hypothetical protein
MENELGETEEALQEMREGSEGAGESVEEMGDNSEQSGGQLLDLATIMTGLNSVLEIASKAFDLLKGAITAVYEATVGMVLGAAEAAAELVDLSTKTGISTTQLQELSYVGDQVGTSLDTITGAQARLVRSMANAQEQQAKFDEQLANGVMEDEIKVPIEMAAAFNGLGVAFTDSAGNLRNQQDVFSDLIDALGKVLSPAERDALATDPANRPGTNPLIGRVLKNWPG